MTNIVSNNYVTIKIPKGLAEEVDKIVADKSKGFRSRNEFCVNAIRKEVEMQKKGYFYDESEDLIHASDQILQRKRGEEGGMP